MTTQVISQTTDYHVYSCISLTSTAFYTQTNVVQYYMTFTRGFIPVNYLIKKHYLYIKIMPWPCNESGSASAVTSVVQHLQLL